MAFACDTCGKVMASEGGMEVHQAGHRAESAADAARADAARRAMEEAVAGGSVATTASAHRPATPSPVRALGVAIALLLVAGLIGAVNPHLVTKKKQTVVAGVGPQSVAIPGTSAAVPAGHRVAENDKFSIAVPAAWFDFHPGKDDVNRMMAEAARVNPKFAAAITDQVKNAVAQRIVFMSIDRSTGDNVNVISLGSIGNDTVSDIPVAALEKQLTNVGATNLSHTTTNLPAGPALVETGQLRFGQASVPMTQYYVLSHGTGYILTFTGCTCHPTEMASTFQTH